MIQTVNGKIDAKDLGITMCHEHFIIDLSKVRGEDDSTLQDTKLMLKEVEKLKALGCQAVVEVTANDMGRDVIKLREISKAAGLHIIASTGFYLAPYHPKWLQESTIEDLKALFKKEITEGIEGTGIKAGIIGEVATSKNKILQTEEKVLRAAARASKELDCAVSTHCDMGTMGNEQVELMLSEGAHPDKLILGHIDLVSDILYHKGILEKGVNLAFDTIGKTKYLTDEKRADHLFALLDAGYEDHLLLSQDVSRKSYLCSYGGKGYTAVLGYFIDLLKERGISKPQLDKMLIHNPARILDRAC
ncbi:MAG: phosphotriesterase-related protein [Clostridia bacterium]|jgi:phosphotriesterase-related protein|nr:phosphotriesterase-related protein [Clostridia bacterium]